MRSATKPREPTPVKTWNMCRPVIAQKRARKGGGEAGQRCAHSPARRKGRRPSSIRCFHSIKCSTRKAVPPTIVAKIQRRADLSSFAAEALTAITSVKLDASRQSVIVVEKMIDGKMGKGVGHWSLAARAYESPMSSAEKVIA